MTARFYYRAQRAQKLVTIPAAESCSVLCLLWVSFILQKEESVKSGQDWLHALGVITHWNNGENECQTQGEEGRGERHTDLSLVFKRKGKKRAHERKKSNGIVLRVINRGIRLLFHLMQNKMSYSFSCVFGELSRTRGQMCSRGTLCQTLPGHLFVHSFLKQSTFLLRVCQMSLLPFSTGMTLRGLMAGDL